MTGTAMAEGAKVTLLTAKDLPESPGKEALMITVEHAPGGSNASHRHNDKHLSTSWRAPS